MAKSVAVIGAGLAGVVTAIALSKKGFQVTMYEKINPVETLNEAKRAGEAPVIQFGDVGGGITVLGNGMKVLKQLGLLDTIVNLSPPHDETNYVLMDGTDRIVKYNHKKGEIETYQVLRSRFHANLMKAAHEHGIKLFTNKKIKSLVEEGEQVVVEFEDGSTVAADFVVGADGIHSVTRRLLFPSAGLPQVFGTGYVGVVPLGKQGEAAVLDHQWTIYADPMKARVVFAAQCGFDTAELFVVELDDSHKAAPTSEAPTGTATSTTSITSTTITTGSTSTARVANEDWRATSDLGRESRLLADQLVAWGATSAVVESVRKCKRLVPVALYDLPDLPSFSKGRVVLVGDAAHGTVPFYGQGVNQAFEDAAVLAELMAHFDNHPHTHDNNNSNINYKKAFQLYDTIRIPLTRKCAQQARMVAARMKAGSRAEFSVGRFMMKLVFRLSNYFRFDDGVYFHDYRDDLKKAVPDICF